MLYKKTFIVVMAILLVLVFSTSTVSFASSNDSNEHQTLFSSDILLENSTADQLELNRIIDNNSSDNILKGPRYKYKTVYLNPVYKKVSGYAGNQPEGGTSFPSGGGFYYSDGGGPVVSASVTVSLPYPYNVCSFSINLGSSVKSSGNFVTVPSTTGYYKLFIVKTMKIVPYKVLRARVGTNNWEFYNGGSSKSVYARDLSAVRVR